MATATRPPPEDATPQDLMADKLRTEAGKSIYKMCRAIVAQVFGQIKERRGFRRFSFRGVGNVSLEWKLICLTGNRLKLGVVSANGLKQVAKTVFATFDGRFATV